MILTAMRRWTNSTESIMGIELPHALNERISTRYNADPACLFARQRAVALERNLTLVTSNQHFQRVPGLTVMVIDRQEARQ